MIYRPIREKSVERLKEIVDKLVKSTGYDEISLSSLSTSDYSKLSELTDYLVDEYASNNIGISLPSLRLDNFSMEIAEKIQQVRKSGLTFAPEAGTQRLRDVINKGVSEEDLQNATKKAFEIDSIGVMAVIVLCMVVISLALAVCFISCSNEGVYTNNPTFFDLFYYTIITFATVGYGDISPVSPVAKFMSIIISMTSILCLTVFISSVLSYKNE